MVENMGKMGYCGQMTEKQARFQLVIFCWVIVWFMLLTIAMQASRIYRLSNESHGYRETALKYGSEIQGVRNSHLESESRNVQLAEKIVELHREVLRERMVRRVMRINPKAPAEKIVDAVLRWSERFEVSPVLVLAVVEQESHYDVWAKGPAGERGLMQIHKDTAPRLGLPWNQAFDIDRNIEAGVKYLSWHLAKFGNERKALVRYNGGGEYPKLVQQRKI